MSKTVTIELSDDALLAYQRWLEWRKPCDLCGDMSKVEREEIRSYAAEFIGCVVRQNPEAFPEYAEHLVRVQEARLRHA